MLYSTWHDMTGSLAHDRARGERFLGFVANSLAPADSLPCFLVPLPLEEGGSINLGAVVLA